MSSIEVGGNLFEQLQHRDGDKHAGPVVVEVLDRRLRAAVHEWNAETTGTCNHAGVPECQKEADRLRWFLLQGIGGD